MRRTKTPACTALAVAFLLAGGISAVAQGLHGTLRFINDDLLPGRFHAIEAARVMWNLPNVDQPTPFQTSKIRDIKMVPATWKSGPDAKHEVALTLTNGDELCGQLLSMTDSEITLGTWYAGQMVFRRAMVRNLAIRDIPDVFRGPGVIEEWTQAANGNAWRIDDANTLLSTAAGGIARDIPLPDEFSLEFEVRWENWPRLHLILFSDDPTTNSPENGYKILIERNSMYLRPCGKREWIGNSTPTTELQHNGRTRIRLQASARTGQFAIHINDRLIAVWTDPDIDATKLGSALHFISRDNSPIVISRIQVSKWNGILEQEPPADEEVPVEEDEKAIMLRNGERIDGVIKSMRDGIFHLESQTLPLGEIRFIDLEASDWEEPKRERNDVRAWFADGRSIVFRLEGITEDGTAIRGHSQTFGTANFDLTAFSRIEFNIYNLFR